MVVRGDEQAPVRVGLLGVGVIGRVHLQVLGSLDGVAPAFVVDPAGPAAAYDVPWFETLAEALAAGPAPDLLVVATPTDSHVAVVGEVLSATGATVLCEKPLTRRPEDVDDLERRHGAALARLRVVDHFAFAPEVVWAVTQVAARGWSAPDRVVSSFHDPYVLKSPRERASYVSSWVDSGTNQLAVLGRFVDDLAVGEHHEAPDGTSAWTLLDHAAGSATLVSSWRTGASSKQTSLRWADGRELFLDHTAMTAHASVGGRVLGLLGNDGSVPRKVAHYRPMYDALLAGGPESDELLGLERARGISSVLAAATGSGHGGDWRA